MADLTQSFVFSARANEVLAVWRSHPTSWRQPETQALRQDIRSFLRRAQRLRCAYCKDLISVIWPHNCQIDHIAPQSKYPQFAWEPLNLTVCCSDCNLSKGANDVFSNGDALIDYPKTGSAFNIYQPYFDRYEDHILRIERRTDRSEILPDFQPLTEKGRATIIVCKLYRFLAAAVGYGIEVADTIEGLEELTEGVGLPLRFGGV